ncbi:hypothetical protein [Thermococcus sp. LS2]|uniref:hypothetical protein n=1 Tax=Thermococcus sp. LS2 TaxID=1638260 RepID=UPI00143AD1EF|nr:hypothetical protein [Thermococcus sp. LS2]NJE13786.1 hypothetical protein [Thermococcus sp. LS2]
MLDLSSLTTLNISALIVLASVVLYYFGRLIADTHVEQADKSALYVTGFIFVVFFILVPGIVIYYIQDYLTWIPLIIPIVLQILIFSMLSWTLKTYEYFLKHDLLDIFRKNYIEKLEEIKKNNTMLGSLFRNYEDIIKRTIGDPVSFFLNALELNRKISSNYIFLMLASAISILSIHMAISKNSLIFTAVTSILGVFIFTMIALVYGFSTAYYPPAVIYLRDGEILRGKLLKFGDFVYLLDEDRKVKIFVNKHEIKYLEESLFKNQWPESQSKGNGDLTST